MTHEAQQGRVRTRTPARARRTGRARRPRRLERASAVGVDENRFIEEHGFGEYAKWHLGFDASHAEDTKARYRFPYGDFENVHRCAVLAAETRAAEYDHHTEIERSAAHLHGMLDAVTRA